MELSSLETSAPGKFFSNTVVFVPEANILAMEAPCLRVYLPAQTTNYRTPRGGFARIFQV